MSTIWARPDGGYRRIELKGGNTSWEWLCSPLEVIADTRDADNGEWDRLLRVTDRDGVTKEWAMPMSLLAGDGTAMRERLLSMGLVLASGLGTRDGLNRCISTAQPNEEGSLRQSYRLARTAVRSADRHHRRYRRQTLPASIIQCRRPCLSPERDVGKLEGDNRAVCRWQFPTDL